MPLYLIIIICLQIALHEGRFAKTAFLQGESAYFGFQKCLFRNAKKPISEFYLAEVGKEYGYGHVPILLKMTLKGGRR